MSATGIATTPIIVNVPLACASIRADVRRICPLRRLEMIGDVGVRFHTVRRARNLTNTKTRKSAITIDRGDWANFKTRFEPDSTTLQNASATAPDLVPTAGTTTLVVRRLSCHSMGLVQRSLVVGPVGPLYGPPCRSPQRPSNASHANASVAAGASSGNTTTSGRSSVDGPVLSSQPNPSPALRPMCNAESK